MKRIFTATITLEDDEFYLPSAFLLGSEINKFLKTRFQKTHVLLGEAPRTKDQVNMFLKVKPPNNNNNNMG